MEIYRGVPAFSGIAIGKILYYHRGEYQIREYLIYNVKREQDSFREAVAQVQHDLEELYDVYRVTDTSGAQVFQRQVRMLQKGSFQRAVENMIATEKVNAAYAIMTTRDELSNTFRNLEEPIIQDRISDVRDISDRLIRLLGGTGKKISLGENPVILAAETLSPGEIMEMEKDKILAVVTTQGSNISHTSIVTKNMEVPSIVEVKASMEWDGREAIVDGYDGVIYLDPDEEMLKEYRERQNADREEKEELLKLRDQEDCTVDGKKICLYANIGNLDDLDSVLYYGATGIGLLRSEFQYLGRENYPRENELFRAYKKVAQTMGDRLVIIRTVDLGADKQAEYMNIPQEDNPIMGNRGIRLCLDRQKMFKAQLRAIYRASPYGNLAIMYPMITSVEEVEEIEKIVSEVMRGLDEKGIPYKNIKKGIMIETPAAVMLSSELAEHSDFLSIGTNDLTQYTLAMDRQNPVLRKKYNDHHPAVLKMIQMVIEAGHAKKCRVCICGELAADESLTEQFLRMGVDALSVVPACILPVRKALRKTDLSIERNMKYGEEQSRPDTM